MATELTFPEVLDSTLLASFKSCPQLFWKQYVRHFKPKGLSVHLHAGASFAKGLEAARTEFYVNGRSAEDSIAKGLGALMEAYGDFVCPDDSAKSLARMLGALEYYFMKWPLGEDLATPIKIGDKRGIEFSFAHPLPINHPETGNPLVYCGRMDQLVDYAGGVFIEDDKTASQLGASWPRQWDLRSQFTGYAWGCRESGIKADGVLVRGVSILKTKYDHAEALSYRPAWQIDRWFDELTRTGGWIYRMLEAWTSSKWLYNLDHSCADFGGCTFRLVCQSEDEAPWLEQYFERRAWNPITREETLLDSPKPQEVGVTLPRIDLDTPL